MQALRMAQYVILTKKYHIFRNKSSITRSQNPRNLVLQIVVIQGQQSLSAISNFVLTDRKKAINIKIMVNPVKGRWEI